MSTMLMAKLNSLILQHLKKVAPDLTLEFQARFKCLSSESIMNSEEINCMSNFIIDHAAGFHENYSNKELIDLVSNSDSLSCQSDSDPDDDMHDGIRKSLSKDRDVVDTFKDRKADIIDLVSSSSESMYDYDMLEKHSEIKNSNQLVAEEEEHYFLEALETQFKCYQSVSSSSSSEYDMDSGGSSSDEGENKKHSIMESSNASKLILDCPVYCELQKNLKDPGESIVDKIVLHILDKNIPISQLNFDHVIPCKSRTRGVWNKNRYPKKVHIEKLSPQDSNIILSNWHSLMNELKIPNPKEIFEKFYKRFTKEEELKANVLGLYLGQGLVKVRLAADIFYHAEDKILEFNKGKLSLSERTIIKDYVEKHGDSLDAFTQLTELLNRRDAYSVRSHFFYSKENEKMVKKGIPYSLSDEKLLIDALMSKFNIKSAKEIKKIKPTRSDVIFKEIAKTFGRHMISLRNHWEAYLKPLLLQFHAGTVNLDVRRPLVNYFLEKNIRYRQEAKWSELLNYSHFEGHTERSLSTIFSTIVINIQRKYRCKREEVTIERMSDWVNDRCNPHKLNTTESKALRRKLEIIDYYKSVIDND